MAPSPSLPRRRQEHLWRRGFNWPAYHLQSEGPVVAAVDRTVVDRWNCLAPWDVWTPPCWTVEEEHRTMFKRIMVPLDGSKAAERALPPARQLAAALGAELRLVHVTEPAEAIPWRLAPLSLHAEAVETMMSGDERAARAYLETLRTRLVAAGVAVTIECLSGYAAATLIDYEREAQIDLVVLASHGRAGPGRFALGTVAERLLRHGSAALLLVHASGAHLHLEQAVVPLDGSQAAQAALACVERLAPDVVHKVALVRAIERPDQRQEAERHLMEAATALHQKRLTTHCSVIQADPARAIIARAGREKLIVMARHGCSGVRGWTLGPVAERVAHGGVPGVLLVPASVAPTG